MCLEINFVIHQRIHTGGNSISISATRKSSDEGENPISLEDLYWGEANKCDQCGQEAVKDIFMFTHMSIQKKGYMK